MHDFDDDWIYPDDIQPDVDYVVLKTLELDFGVILVKIRIIPPSDS